MASTDNPTEKISDSVKIPIEEAPPPSYSAALDFQFATFPSPEGNPLPFFISDRLTHLPRHLIDAPPAYELVNLPNPQNSSLGILANFVKLTFHDCVEGNTNKNFKFFELHGSQNQILLRSVVNKSETGSTTMSFKDLAGNVILTCKHNNKDKTTVKSGDRCIGTINGQSNRYGESSFTATNQTGQVLFTATRVDLECNFMADGFFITKASAVNYVGYFGVELPGMLDLDAKAMVIATTQLLNLIPMSSPTGCADAFAIVATFVLLGVTLTLFFFILRYS